MTLRDVLPPLLALAALGALAFLGLSGSALNFLITTLIIALAGLGWNVLGGFGGQYSFGHAAFFGTGAYATAVLQLRFGWNAWAGLAAGIGLGTATGLLIGTLSFRAGLRGSYFALVTLAFAEVFRILANAADLTGGAAGLLLTLQPGFGTMQFVDRRLFCLLVLGFVGAALLASRWIERSRFGAQLIAVRENEEAARALGVDALRVKLGAIALSAAITAAAGALYVQHFLYLDAGVAYGTWISVEALLAPIVGGIGTAFGPLVGALALQGLGEATKHLSGGVPGLDLVVFGICLVAVIAFAPQGLIGLLRRRAAAAGA
ncbi:branched-chain amino acid ABC transporter permease [Methylobacterium sp. WSM2598]|uniref:branched-chain amino acid ABC transporter permease n=1 Tax=Methylobacterium sp. WSM2598 TaxID=398261 RepID=UPI00035D368A|nr:branched-chain amino acid ABC transporter permease [Methylobacterium sp. WSM2598]